MSDNENTTTQNTPVPPATPAGPTMEELKAQYEREREGFIRDLQKERQGRQEAERRLAAPPAPSPENQDVNGDELYKVIAPVLDRHPLAKKIQMLEAHLAEEKAKSFLTTKTGKKWEDIEADKPLQEKLQSIVMNYKLMGTPDDVVRRAYSIMELEDVKSKEVERERAGRASANASMPSGTPPAPVASSKEYDADAWRKLDPSEYDRLNNEGTFRKVGANIVYTKNS